MIQGRFNDSFKKIIHLVNSISYRPLLTFIHIYLFIFDKKKFYKKLCSITYIYFLSLYRFSICNCF